MRISRSQILALQGALVVSHLLTTAVLAGPLRLPCDPPPAILKLAGGPAPQHISGTEGRGYVYISHNRDGQITASVGIKGQGSACIPEVRNWGYDFGLKIGDIIPFKGRLYYLRTLIDHDAKLDTAILEALSVADTEKLGVNPPTSSMIVPLRGGCTVDLVGDAGSIKVRKYTPANGAEKAIVRLQVDILPQGVRFGKGRRSEPVEKDFGVGDLIPIPPIIKTPPPQVNLRVHRIVAPDPDKHIPGWVELRFEPKDKPASEIPGNEKPGSEKPTNEKPASPETPSKTKSEDTKKPTDPKPKPK